MYSGSCDIDNAQQQNLIQFSSVLFSTTDTPALLVPNMRHAMHPRLPYTTEHDLTVTSATIQWLCMAGVRITSSFILARFPPPPDSN